jgi:acetyltransferase-like isoleucine patch superfamily enzyme
MAMDQPATKAAARIKSTLLAKLQSGPLRRWLPATTYPVDPAVVLIVLTHISVLRTLYYSARFKGWCLIDRGTRLKIGRGSRIQFAPGAFLFVGFLHYNPTPCAMHIGRNATLSVVGTAYIHRGARVFVHDGALFEIGNRTHICDNAVVTCFDHIKFGEDSGTSWNSNIQDTVGHVFIVNGESRPISKPIIIGDRVLIGSGATVLSGVHIGDAGIVAAGSVVSKDVPAGALVAGNPARVIYHDVVWIP